MRFEFAPTIGCDLALISAAELPACGAQPHEAIPE